jgi:hypothetical protein
VLATVVPWGSAAAQEIGIFSAAGLGGLRDVRRPFGGGVSGTMLYRDQIGVRLDAGWYVAREHRNSLDCVAGVAEPLNCKSMRLLSKSSYPLLDAALVVRHHIPRKGVRIELGGGPTNVAITNEIVTDRDSVYSPRVRSSANGYVLLGAVLVHPQWPLPVSLEGMYAYHKTSELGGCLGRTNEPLCSQRFHLHEMRVSLFYRPRPKQ